MRVEVTGPDRSIRDRVGRRWGRELYRGTVIGSGDRTGYGLRKLHFDHYGEGRDAERNSSLILGVLHVLVVFAAPMLLWNTTVVDLRLLSAWTTAEAFIGLSSLAASWSIQNHRLQWFRRLSAIESLGTALTFSALAWLGDDIASSTPSKYVLIIALIAVTSISASNSSHITRRRPVFGKLIVMVATSYTVAFVVHSEILFASFTLLWSIAITLLTRVGYHGMLELLELRKASELTARHDDLTGLLSRTAFFETLRGTAARQPDCTSTAEPVLVLFDLDGFKAINDSFGHASGDGVLRTVAERLTTFLPEQATLGRLGGDEFAAVFWSDEKILPSVIDSALEALSEPVRLDGRELYVAASAGWTVIRIGSASADLMAEADAAMYQSKNSETAISTGFNSTLRDELDRSLDLRQRFRTALKRNEIEFWAQPLVRMSDRAPVAVELLARWRQQDDTMIDPEEFTRVADETGLAVQLDRQALATAETLLDKWHADPILGSLLVKANISPVHLHNDGLLTSVQELISVALRDRLGVEFVESRLIQTAERNHHQLRELREMGVTVSVDDFGVGYSSLTYLRELPVSEIKIDRSFVTDLDTDVINQGLVRAIVDIASTLGLPTVAEGIETSAEFAAAAGLGVSLGQGFYMGRPCPLDQIDQVLRALHD